MPKIRQSVAEWCLLQDNLPETYYMRLKDIGFCATELAAPQHWDIAVSCGLEILSVAAPGMKDGLCDRDRHKFLLPKIHDTVLLARDNGIRQLIVFTGSLHQGQSVEDGITNCAAALERLVRGAEETGVLLVIENVNTAEVPDSLAGSSENLFRIIKEVDSPVLKACFDVYHSCTMGEDVAQVIIGNLENIAHIHVSGYPGRDFPGPGQAVDYASLVRDVILAGYSGFWGHEFLPQGDPLKELEKACGLFNSYAAVKGAPE